MSWNKEKSKSEFQIDFKKSNLEFSSYISNFTLSLKDEIWKNKNRQN